MRAAWTNFAADGDPSTAAVPWPSFHRLERAVAQLRRSPQLETTFSATHHCDFWAAG